MLEGVVVMGLIFTTVSLFRTQPKAQSSRSNMRDEDKVFVGDNVSDQECTLIQFVNELTQLRDGYLVLSNALTMSRCEVQQISDFRYILCVLVLHFVFWCVLCV